MKALIENWNILISARRANPDRSISDFSFRLWDSLDEMICERAINRKFTWNFCLIEAPIGMRSDV